MHDGRRLLRELHDLSPVPVTIRAHHLLTSGKGEAEVELKWSSTNVYHEDANGKARYDFTILDSIFDAYKAAGVCPMVELGFMPKDLAGEAIPARPNQPYQVHYPRSTIYGASNNPPKDYAKWGELIRAVTAHLVERYGKGCGAAVVFRSVECRMAALMQGNRVATSSDGQVPLSKLLASGVREQPDVDALATYGEGQAAVMVWNYHDADGPAPGVPTTVTVAGLPKTVGKVLVTHFRIDDTHSNAYPVWKAMGSPQHPSSEQYAQLQSAAGLELFSSPEWVDVAGGQVRLTTEMPRQSLSLFRLTW